MNVITTTSAPMKKPAIRLQQVPGSVTPVRTRQQPATIITQRASVVGIQKRPKTFQRNMNDLKVKIPPADMKIAVKKLPANNSRVPLKVQRFGKKLRNVLSRVIPI